MEFPKIILVFSPGQAWFLYYLLKVVPGKTAKGLRTQIGNLLQALPKEKAKIVGK